MPEFRILSMPDLCEHNPAPVVEQQRSQGEPREEVHTIIRRLRAGVSLWRRLQAQTVLNALEQPQAHLLPQHHLYIK